MQESIFTKIIKGEIPSYKIYEDERTYAFLDVNPAREGHTLVVPKAQIDQYLDLEDTDYTALWQTVKKVAKHLRDVVGVERVALKVIGTDVPHTHVHLIPFSAGDKPYRDESSPNYTQTELAELANKIRM